MKQKKSNSSSIFSNGIAQMLSNSPRHYEAEKFIPLVEAVQLGIAAGEWLKDNPIDDAVSAEYRKIVRKGEIALSEAVRTNVRLVASYVIKVVNRRRGHGLNASGDDLFQCGCIGLQTAISKFEVGRGLKFSTYATHWVKQGVDREMMNFNDNNPIRLPVHLHRFMHKAAVLEKQRASLGLPKLSDNDMCDLVNKEYEAEGSTLPKCSYESFASAHQISASRLVEGNSPFSANDDGDSVNFYDMLAGEDSAYMSFNRVDDATDVSGVLDLLSPKEAVVIKGRFIDDLTLEEVGAELELTRERIRQIQDKALGKLKKYFEGDPTAFMGVVAKRHYLAEQENKALLEEAGVKEDPNEKLMSGITLAVYVSRRDGMSYADICKKYGIKNSKISYELRTAKQIISGERKPQKERPSVETGKKKSKGNAGKCPVMMFQPRGKGWICNDIVYSDRAAKIVAEYARNPRVSVNTIAAKLDLKPNAIYQVTSKLRMRGVSLPVKRHSVVWSNERVAMKTDLTRPTTAKAYSEATKLKKTVTGNFDDLVIEQCGLMVRVNGHAMSRARLDVLRMEMTSNSGLPVKSRDLKMAMGTYSCHVIELQKIKLLK
ncbi:RNA polymerase sigma factor [Vibrio phage D528]